MIRQQSHSVRILYNPLQLISNWIQAFLRELIQCPYFCTGRHKSSWGRGNLLCRQGLEVPEDDPMDCSCAESMLGRYVYIKVNGSTHLRLCEVEVFVNSKLCFKCTFREIVLLEGTQR